MDMQECFEETLNDTQKTFLHVLRAVTEYQPALNRPYAGTGRIPYDYMPFVKSELAKQFFQIDKTGVLIERLRADPDLRLLCGFKKVPGRSAFSRVFCYLANQTILQEAFEKLVKRAFTDRYICSISRGSAAVKTAKQKSKDPLKDAAGRQKTPLKREKNHWPWKSKSPKTRKIRLLF
jgi:hypothetical protein